MSEHIEQRSGWWWPKIDTDAHGVITADCPGAIAQLLHHVEGRDCIVQAGGCVGVYPIALTDHFQKVITFEPDPLNYACLARNLEARDSLDRVQAFRAALGAEQADCHMVVVKPSNIGAHRVEYGRGDINVVAIDDLGLTACDCIWGDVEGSELFVLQGAAKTIDRFSPTVVLEDKGLGQAFGIPPGSVQAWLAPRGYREVARIGLDKVFRRG